MASSADGAQADGARDGHARLMDDVYRGQRHIYDLTRKYYLLGRDQLIHALSPPPGGHVLEMGCGTGRNLICAARRWPDAQFHGVDISDEMLDSARKAVARAGLSARISLARGDATALDARALFGRAAFDRVMFSYTLSMIPDWQGALAQGAALLAPGGRLGLVDFGQQHRLPRWWRSMLLAWLGRFHVAPRAALGPVLTALAERQGGTVRLQSLYRDYAVMGWLETAPTD